jgi:hypothetical protein
MGSVDEVLISPLLTGSQPVLQHQERYRWLRLTKALKTVLYGVASILVISLLIHGPITSACFSRLVSLSKPRTIEERVKRILTFTPLIGNTFTQTT